MLQLHHAPVHIVPVRPVPTASFFSKARAFSSAVESVQQRGRERPAEKQRASSREAEDHQIHHPHKRLCKPVAKAAHGASSHSSNNEPYEALPPSSGCGADAK